MRASANQTVLLMVFLVAIGGALSACGPNHSGKTGSSFASSSSVITAESLAAYQTTVYAFGQSQGCVKCHGQSVSPLWMNPNVSTAYSFALPFVDFNNPTTSVFALNAGNNHCGDPVCAVPANVAVVQDLLLQWAAVELNQSNTGGNNGDSGSTLATPPYVTISMPIPMPLPLVTTGAPAVIRFDLSKVTPAVPALAGSFLDISIQSYNSAFTTYKVFSPKVSGNSVPITITSLHVYVRPLAGTGLGVEDVHQGLLWDSLHAVAPPVGLNLGASLVNTALGVSAQSSADVITLGFLAIQ